jgi:hypothetical protein
MRTSRFQIDGDRAGCGVADILDRVRGRLTPDRFARGPRFSPPICRQDN